MSERRSHSPPLVTRSQGRAWRPVPTAQHEISIGEPPERAARTSAIALPLLLQLRWLAGAGQALLLLLAYVSGAELPYVAMWSIVAITLASNLLLQLYGERASFDRHLLSVLTLDTLLLTVLLGLSGGPHNPFTALYVVHIALGAVATSSRGTAWIAALSGGCYAAMFRWHLPQPLWHGGMEDMHAGHVGAHLVGMWLALAVVAVVITYFITRLVQQLASARAQAARNDRLASLTTLAAGAAHELGSPLGTIAVAASEIARATHGAVQEDARLIREEVERCRAILDRMSGAAAGLRPESDLQSLELTVRGVRHELGEACARLDVEWRGTAAARIASREPIHQAVKTLVQNALDASTDRVRLRIAEDGRSLVFTVIDRGPGLSDTILSHVGEPFVTTKEPGKGTGLGLYVVRLIAERLGGSLHLRSTPGIGTEATFSLPLASPQLGLDTP